MGSIPQHLFLLHPTLLKASLLPWPRGAFGPVTAHRLLRLIAGYQLVVAIGACSRPRQRMRPSQVKRQRLCIKPERCTSLHPKPQAG